MSFLGPYANFIWPVYGITALALTAMFILTLRQLKRLKSRLEK